MCTRAARVVPCTPDSTSVDREARAVQPPSITWRHVRFRCQNREMRDLTVVSQGVPLAVRDFGGVGHPVVLLHGLGRSLVDWSVIGPMLGSSHRTVAFDLRGHGESGDGSWAWAAALADISAVANRLDLGTPAVVG